MSNYTLNFAPITLSGETTIFVGTQPYSKEALDELRQHYRATHVFRRRGKDDVIVEIPTAAGAKPLSSLQEEIDLNQSKEHWPQLISAALIRAFAGARDIISDYPVTVLGSAARGLVHHPDLPEWVERRTALQFDTRTHYMAGGRRVVGLVCESRIRNLINGSCAELLEMGVPIVGRYVQVEQDREDSRLTPRRKLIGRVAAIEDGILILDDHEQGYDRIAAEEAFAESRAEAFDEIVGHLLGAKAAPVIAQAEQTAQQLHAGPGRKKQIEEALAFLRDKANLEAVPGVSVRIGALIVSSNSDFPPNEIMPKPVLVFDPSSARKDDWSERGLKASGPYDQRTFSPKKLNIAVICQAKHEGQVDRFVAKFLDGMPDAVSGRNSIARYGDGFIRRFNLEKPKVAFFTTATASAHDYVEASRKALRQAADEGFKWNLALVQVEEEFKKYGGDDNPYYATKAVLLKRDVAVQSVRLDLPCHVGAFRAWALDRTEELAAAVLVAASFTGQARHPEHVAALGFGAAAGILSDDQKLILREELEHLKGRAFFVAGRPRRFEVDGICLLGVALGTKSGNSAEVEKWCKDILSKSVGELVSDPWHQGLARLASVVLGDKVTIRPAELAVVAAEKGYGLSSQTIEEEAWSAAVQSCPLENKSGLDAVRLAVFDIVSGRLGQVRLASPSREDLIHLLRNLARGFKRWTYEKKPRTARSAVARWDIENEYQVQNLLWAVLATVFSDVDDEEHLPSIGHAHPRADLGIPSLRTLIEVKYIRQPGQTRFKAVMDEISADTGLYLSKSKDYDTIVAVVWDDCAQTEQHHELQSGIEQLNGVTAAIILSRPSHMKRQKDGDK